MPTRILRAVGLAAFAVVACAFIPVSAGATKPADLRVVDSSGETLTEHTQYTGKAKIKARAEADCFGDGTGGSDGRATVPGATALGIVDDAAKWDSDIKPVLVTDSFDFGLGVCGFGNVVAPQTGYWYLSVNHVAAEVGGDQAKLGRGDSVLWFLIEDFNEPIPSELVLDAPARTADETVEVRVWEYAPDGTRTPAVGAAVSGADRVTDSEGRTTVTPLDITGPLPDPTSRELQASRSGAISSNTAEICLSSDLARCTAKPSTTIYGSAKAEAIKGTGGDDKIAAGNGKDVVRSGGGNDTIDVRKGGKDVVYCSDDDRVKADGRDQLKGCA